MTQALINKVTKANELVEASYRLTLQEQRLLLLCVSEVNSGEFGRLEAEYTVHAETFARIYGVSINDSYNDLKQASDKLYERDIKLKGQGKDEGKDIRMRWVDKVEYHQNRGKVTLSFTKTIAPLLTKLGKNFTSYTLGAIANLKSVYSIRLYELLIKEQNMGKSLELPLAKFRDSLGIEENKYKRFADLKKRVIDPAVEELGIKSGLEISWHTIREGRSVVQLFFAYDIAKQQKLGL